MASRSPTNSAVAAPPSDMEGPSSPPNFEGQSFMGMGDDDTMDMTPEPTEKITRGGKGKWMNKDQSSMATIGKIRHLKKDDGEPLWRRDIQYDFLRAVFDDETAVFTNSYEDKGPQNFADLYIDTMSRSSKTSKVLRDKLLSDRDAAKGMAMVCLLVNIGRMNTTLNFFPEMRAQLRTYHAIPSLQAHQDPHAYKQLQDAPRLKSILKGGAEDRTEPSTLNKIKAQPVPRTNPVNLLFVLCSTAAKVAELHFPLGREFHDLVMKTNYTSQSRARAFLWIMWFYLESDFTEEGCEENPFGPGVDYGIDVANQGVPELEEMTPDDEAQENIDSPSELEFGREKQKMRAKILQADQQFIENQNKRGSRASRVHADEQGPAILPRIRPSRHESDMDSTRSTPPPKMLAQGGIKGSGRRGGHSLKHQLFDGSSPAPGSGQAAEGIVGRKPRPPTAHQLAVERNRNQRVEHILDRGLREEHRKAKKFRKQESSMYRAIRRCEEMEDPFEDSDVEEELQADLAAGVVREAGAFRHKGMGGLATLKSEKDDFGEEATAYAAALRRMNRRLDRWEQYKDTDKGVIPPVKRRKLTPPEEINGDADETIVADEELEESFILPPPTKRGRGGGRGRGRGSRGGGRGRGRSNGNADVTAETIADASEGEKEGGGSGGRGGDQSGGEEEELDEMERSLLGMAPGGDSHSESDDSD